MAKHGGVVRTTIALSVWLLGFTMVIQAQAIDRGGESTAAQAAPHLPDQSELEARERALRKWEGDYTKWKRVCDQKADTVGSRDCGPRPEPPDWLFEDCRDIVVDDNSLWGRACQLVANWKDDTLTAEIRRQVLDERAQREAPTKGVWWRHVHLDTLWPMTRWGSRVYGVVGAHATVEVAGRLQVFVAPGAMLLTTPGERGARDWKWATDWGFAYRLLDFRLPGAHRQAQLHVNLVTAWILSDPGALVENRINLAGFSFTFKPRPAP